jgi:hypothetical protein
MRKLIGMKLEEANYFIVAKEFNVLHIIGE